MKQVVTASRMRRCRQGGVDKEVKARRCIQGKGVQTKRCKRERVCDEVYVKGCIRGGGVTKRRCKGMGVKCYKEEVYV